MNKHSRCEECGYPLRGAERCPRHPGALPVDWPQKRFIAYNLVCRAAGRGLTGAALDAWVEETKEGEADGTTPGDLAVALTYARKWKRQEFNESGLPSLVTPKGLYG